MQGKKTLIKTKSLFNVTIRLTQIVFIECILKIEKMVSKQCVNYPSIIGGVYPIPAYQFSCRRPVITLQYFLDASYDKQHVT